MGMIRRNAKGRYYCDGRNCGYQLMWLEGDDWDGEPEWEVVCPDCGAGMYASPPSQEPQNSAAATTSITIGPAGNSEKHAGGAK